MKNIEDIELKTQILSKLAIIEKIFENKSVAVAFSGGIDSSLLLYLAKSYATSVLPIFFNTPTTPTIELNHALKISETFGLKLHKIDLNTLEQPEIAHNGLQRCYFCKSYLLKILIHEATKNNFEVYADGTNFSDLGAIRPGLKALRESKVISPLAQAELSKSEIIEISKQLELPSANFMSQACLASRIPFNIDLNSKILKMVDSAEQFLFENFPKYHGSIRVRLQVLYPSKKYLARIEVDDSFVQIYFKDPKSRQKIVDKFKRLGFTFTTLDLQGFVSGSLHKAV